MNRAFLRLTAYGSGEPVLICRDDIQAVVGLSEMKGLRIAGMSFNESRRTRIEIANDRMVLVAETADQVIALL